jgi:hypothetical protein
MYYRRLKFCIIYLALNKGCFETILMKNTPNALATPLYQRSSSPLEFENTWLQWPSCTYLGLFWALYNQSKCWMMKTKCPWGNFLGTITAILSYELSLPARAPPPTMLLPWTSNGMVEDARSSAVQALSLWIIYTFLKINKYMYIY